MRHSNDMFRYTFKAEFVRLVSLKVPSGPHLLLSTTPFRGDGGEVGGEGRGLPGKSNIGKS